MGSIECKNPFTGENIGSFKIESFESQKNKVALLNQAQMGWKKLTVAERLGLVKEALEYFEKHKTQIALDISEQMGRPLHYAGGEIQGFFERASYLCDIAEQTLSPDIFSDKPGFQRSIEHCPYGTIFVIAAWNYPLLITVNSIIPALIAGNTVLLKHSSLTPKIGQHFERAFKTMGTHDNLLLNSVLDHSTTGKVIEDLGIHHVVFTGSVSGGKQILKHTMHRFINPGLELGGKDGAYVHSDADLEHAAASIVDGCMFNSGQSCCGIERVYVHESVYDSFLDEVKTLVDNYRLGDPKDPETTMGPLAQSRSAQFIAAQVKEAQSKGAKILAGGKSQVIEKGTFFQPTVLVNVNQSMEVMREENFGPILPIMKVTDIEEAVGLINQSDYGLTCAVFTKSIEVAEQVAQDADTGTVFMNRCDYLDPALPWTGVKNSGVGSSLSKYGFYSVTRRKALHFKVEI